MIRGKLDMVGLGIVPFLERGHNSPNAPIYQGYVQVSSESLPPSERANLSVRGVWGYRMIKLYAEKHEREKPA